MEDAIRLGIIGNGRIAHKFVEEAKHVGGVVIENVFGVNERTLSEFAFREGIANYTTNLEKFLDRVDCVYIASPHLTHYGYAKQALEAHKHVLCEKPMSFTASDVEELFQLSEKQGCVLLEAIKTAFCPGFLELVPLAKSGIIGEIKYLSASFTKLVEPGVREVQKALGGGSMTELSSYPLLAAVKILGTEYRDASFCSYIDKDHDVDMFTKINLLYDKAVATCCVGLGVKTEGELIISGTKGYILVKSPWWKTQSYEVRFEDPHDRREYYCEFEADGLRYELREFVRLITGEALHTHKLTKDETKAIIGVIEKYRASQDISLI